VILLLLIGFVAGVITAVSPCVLPVLPIVLAGGASGGRRRPYAIIAGLVASFTLFTLTASAILSALGLPQDLLRNIAIALLFVVAATLFVPRLGMLLETPLARLSRRPSGDLGGGFLLGVSLGLVFVPCAGPVLATVTVLSAQHRFGAELVFLTLFYAFGAGLVLLLIAVGGQRVSRRLRTTRRWWRPALGSIIAAAAFGVVFNLDQTLQTHLGSYTSALQRHTEESTFANKHLNLLRGIKASAPTTSTVGLRNFGPAPNFAGISHWINTPDGRSLSISQLHGKVVLVDFWTYSCINCLRTLPQLRAWYDTYKKDGLVIVGVHTPEFAFEHDYGNVRSAVHRLDVTWPVALDNTYTTWSEYSNQYWPADYLVDRNGDVRAVHFGEGDYMTTEDQIRALLGAGGPLTSVQDTEPTGAMTPETYLGPQRLDQTRYVGTKLVVGKAADYVEATSVPQNFISYGGEWTLSGQTATAGLGATLALHFHAKKVYIVLTGRGTVAATLGARRVQTLKVDSSRLYTVLTSPTTRDGVLRFRFTPGVRAYSFTFG
jgi:cytochrome c biogenesis protein CcdA/thiol-disulfide isomerase/thioredoxin